MTLKTNLEYFKAFNESVELENVTFHEVNESGGRVFRCRVSKVIHSLPYKPGRTKPPYIGKILDLDEHWIEDPGRKKFDYITFRMIHCSECKRAHNNDGCRGDNNEIDNCLDASAPFDDIGYMYGA